MTGEGIQMRRVIVRYRVRPERVAENEALVRAVYAELAQARPLGMRYSTQLLDDGCSFVHLHESDGSSTRLTELPAFEEFQRELLERCDEPPVVSEATEIGSYQPPAEAP
jgi:hypothetical protein